jgi:hypothetical protein
VKTKKRLPQYKGVIYLPVKFPEKMYPEDKRRFKSALGFGECSNDN